MMKKLLIILALFFSTTAFGASLNCSLASDQGEGVLFEKSIKLENGEEEFHFDIKSVNRAGFTLDVFTENENISVLLLTDKKTKVGTLFVDEMGGRPYASVNLFISLTDYEAFCRITKEEKSFL